MYLTWAEVTDCTVDLPISTLLLINWFLSSQILDVATGRIIREFATHTYPVRGMEWTSLNSILSYGYQSLSGKTRSDLVMALGYLTSGPPSSPNIVVAGRITYYTNIYKLNDSADML